MSYYLDKEADEQLSSTSRKRSFLSSESSDDEGEGGYGSDNSEIFDYPISKYQAPEKSKKRGKENGQGSSTKKRRKEAGSRPERDLSSIQISMLQEMKKTNKILSNLTNRVKGTEKRLTDIENQLSQPSASSTDTATPKRNKKADVPDGVRVSYVASVLS